MEHTILKFVSYLRVSTKNQEKSGLGLESQRRDIKLFLGNLTQMHEGCTHEFLEVDSGGNTNRKILNKAIEFAKKEKAILIVSKLDRLSRKVSCISRLLEIKTLEIKVASMPNADKFQLHIYAALAEQEREFISMRTKAALYEAKLKGIKLGGLRDSTNKRNKGAILKANQFAATIWPAIEPMIEAKYGYTEISNRLNAIGIKSVTGGQFWASTVKNIIHRQAVQSN